MGRNDEERLTADIVELARQYGRYGYRKIAELLRTTAGWVVNDKRVERIWRCEGLKVPAKQPKKGRLWLAATARACDCAPNGRTMSDPMTSSKTEPTTGGSIGCSTSSTSSPMNALRSASRGGLTQLSAIDVLSDLFILRGAPEYVRSDNGPEFVAKAVQEWIAAVRGEDGLYRARQSLGERLRRELQRQAPRRAHTETARSCTRCRKPKS